MGKTTRFHPVSLHVIRGAAEYCGFKFGKIRQTSFESEAKFAEYEAEITRMPSFLSETGWGVVRRQLQHCFAVDITVENVWRSKSGIWRGTLLVKFPDHPDMITDPLEANSEVDD